MKTVLISVVGVIFSLSVFAMGDKPKFDEMDRDGNGYIDQMEATAAEVEERKFTKLDGNKDGRVSKEEYKAHKSNKDDDRDRGNY